MGHRGDAADLGFMSRAPTDAPVTRVRDVLVCPTTQAQGDFATHPPAGASAVDLGRDLVLTDFGQAEAELVMNACMPRGHYFVAVRQYGCRYAFVRTLDADVADGPRSFGWDDDNTIFAAMILSRLVRDNGYSLEFAARIVDHADGMQQVIPVYAAEFVASYRLRDDRDWLTAADVQELRQLLDAWWANQATLPERVIRAFNLVEDVVHARVVQRAVPLLVTGFETLLNTNRRQVTKQFQKRVVAVAAEVGAPVSARFARALYEARSEAAHGAPVSMFAAAPPPLPEGAPHLQTPDPAGLEMLAKGQEVVRAVIRRAIEEPAFAAAFASAESVRARWPVYARSRWLRRRESI